MDLVPYFMVKNPRKSVVRSDISRLMSDSNLKITYEQLAWVTEQLEIAEPMKALERFAELMRMEGIPPRKISIVVEKLMELDRKRSK